MLHSLPGLKDSLLASLVIMMRESKLWLQFWKVKRAKIDYLKQHEHQMSWTTVITGAFFDYVSLKSPGSLNPPYIGVHCLIRGGLDFD